MIYKNNFPATEHKLTSQQIIYLKITLLCHGIKISKSAWNIITHGNSIPVSLQEYVTTTGVGLVFGDNIYVNVPFSEDFCASSPYTLDNHDREMLIVGPEFSTPARVIPVPSYFDKKSKSGACWSNIAVTHTDRVRISPIEGCAFACNFCDSSFHLSYRKKPMEDLVESVRVARDDKVLPARHVLISGGHPRKEDHGYLDDVYKTVTQSTDLPVDIMMSPRSELSYIDDLHSWGVNALSINLELHDEAIAKRLMPQKYGIGREHFYKFVEKAVDTFGVGKIQSLLLVGLEPIESTLKGVEKLAGIGCLPVLSPFRPSSVTPLADVPPPSEQDLYEVYTKSLEIVRKHSLYLGPRCIACQHNTLTLPEKDGGYIFY